MAGSQRKWTTKESAEPQNPVHCHFEPIEDDYGRGNQMGRLSNPQIRLCSGKCANRAMLKRRWAPENKRDCQVYGKIGRAGGGMKEEEGQWQ